MNKNNKLSVNRERHFSVFETLVEISTAGLCQASEHHTTKITGPDGGTSTGRGYSRESADKRAGDRYRRGERD